MTRFFRGFAFGLLGLYAAWTWLGWELGATTRGFMLSQSVRQSPGGYRAYTYWRGGK